MEEDISVRIKRVTSDLRAIQEELGWAAIDDPTGGEPARILDELLKQDLIADFKAALDHMRTFLWSYIEAVSRQSGEGVDYAIQSTRMQRVTEMLRLLRGYSDLPQMISQPPGQTFIEEIHAIAGSYLEKHYPQGRAAEPSGND